MVFISAAWEKSTLSGCKQSRATFAKAEKEMSTVCCIPRAQVSPRPSVRMKPRLVSPAGGRTGG